MGYCIKMLILKLWTNKFYQIIIQVATLPFLNNNKINNEINVMGTEKLIFE